MVEPVLMKSPLKFSASLTTLDGKTELDRVDLRLSENDENLEASVSLQGTFELPSPDAIPIVDLRCSTYSGSADQASFIVIAVDDLKKAGI